MDSRIPGRKANDYKLIPQRYHNNVTQETAERLWMGWDQLNLEAKRERSSRETTCCGVQNKTGIGLRTRGECPIKLIQWVPEWMERGEVGGGF